MVIHRSLSDSKSPQVSRTLLGILADLKSAAVRMVSTCPLIFKSSSPSANPLVTLSMAPITIGIIVNYMFLGFFNSLARSRYLSFFSLSFKFTLWSAGTAKSTIRKVLFFFFFLLIIMICSPGRDKAIRLYLKIPEEFVRLILQDRFWVVYIPFFRMVKFQFLAQFPVDHFAYPVVSSLVLFLG